MSYPVQLGLIGAGSWGQNYIRTILNLENVQLRRISSRNTNLNQFNLKDCIITSDWRKLIGCKDLDGVIIATPAYSHAKIAKSFIERGIPIIVEKPLTISKSEAEDLLNTAIKTKSIVKIDHIFLYSPGFRKLKEVSKRENNLLSLKSVGGNFGPFRKDVSSLWDWAPHDLAMCIDIVGKLPINIEAKYIKRKNIDQVEASNIYIELEFDGQIKADINIGNLMINKTRTFELFYKECSLKYDAIKNLNIKRDPYNKGIESTVINSDNTNLIHYDHDLPLSILVKEFADDIINSKFDISEIQLGVNIINIISQISNKL